MIADERMRTGRPVQGILLAGAVVLLGAFVVLLGARKYLPPVASEHGVGIDHMILYLLLTTGTMLLVGHVVLGYFILRSTRAARASTELPSVRAERIWSVLPAVVMTLVAEGGVLVLGLPVLGKFYVARPPEDAVVVEVIAEQFTWNVRYPGADGEFGRTDPTLIDTENAIGLDRNDPAAADDIRDLGVIHLPVDRPARIRLRSKDVLHSFFLPNLRVKQDAVPGMTIEIWFVPTKVGEFELACAELCGFGHYQMRGLVEVVSGSDFSRWMAEQSQGAD